MYQAGQFNVRTKWKEFLPLVSELPIYAAVLAQPGYVAAGTSCSPLWSASLQWRTTHALGSRSAPHELFYDFIDDLEDRYSPDRKVLKSLCKSAFADQEAAIASLSEQEFTAKLREQGEEQLAAIDAAHVSVFYQEVRSREWRARDREREPASGANMHVTRCRCRNEQHESKRARSASSSSTCASTRTYCAAAAFARSSSPPPHGLRYHQPARCVMNRWMPGWMDADSAVTGARRTIDALGVQEAARRSPKAAAVRGVRGRTHATTCQRVGERGRGGYSTRVVVIEKTPPLEPQEQRQRQQTASIALSVELAATTQALQITIARRRQRQRRRSSPQAIQA